MIKKKRHRRNRRGFTGPIITMVPIWIVFSLFVLSIFVIFIPAFKDSLVQQKKEMIQTLTQSTVSLLSEYHQKVLSGETPLPEAQIRAMNQIRHLRYGSQGQAYFWIIDRQPFMIMHPFRPELEGRDLTLFRDMQGNHPFMAMVETVIGNGSGFVNYYWQWKDDPHKAAPKVSYVKEFEPWGWIVGTGIYVEDIQTEVSGMLANLVKISVGIMIFALFLSVFITWQTVRTRRREIIAEANLQKEKETLALILESTPHGIALINSNGEYLYVNHHFSDITGYTLEDIPTKKVWFETVYPDKAYRRKVMKTWEDDTHHDGIGEIREFKIVCKNGETKHMEFRSSFLHDSVISVLTDVSSRKNAEEDKREKDRLEGILELSGAICHEMNQPLMSVLGYFELILMDTTKNDPNHAYVKKIQNQLDRMSRITRQLMEISRYNTKDYLDGKIFDLAADSGPGNDDNKSGRTVAGSNGADSFK